MNKPIEKGSTVKYQDGYYIVTARFSNSVNLGAIFGGYIHHKKVPVYKVQEAYEEWRKSWTESEAYQSM
jgi:hypothetical protein